jgi:trehalose 6-phosphate phosphatase
MLTTARSSATRSDNAPSAAQEAIVTPEAATLVELAMRQTPRGIICDIDGTLSPIAATPGGATLAPGAREALNALCSQLDVVAVVSGRAARDAQALVGVQDVVVVGNHGLESIDEHGLSVHPDAVASLPKIREALERIQVLVDADPAMAGVLVEDKGVSGSVHYRLTQDRDYAKSRLNAWAYALADELDLKITHGRLVVEIRPPITINKGAAVRRLVDEYGLHGVLFFGDDVTDIDGFLAVQHLRAERDLSSWAIAVADPEARIDVVEAADASVASVTACIDLLAALAARLDASQGEATG